MINRSLYYYKIYSGLLLFIAIFLPFTDFFSIKFTSIAIILLTAAWLILNDWRQALERLKGEKIIFIFLIFYLINMQGLFRGVNNGITEKILVRKLSLLLLPLIIGTSPNLNYSFVINIVKAFILSLLISSFITFARGANRFITTPEDLNKLAEVIIIHRPYFGLFCGFAILFILFYLNSIKSILLIITGVTISLYLLFFISFIHAKMALLALIMCAVVLVLLWLIKQSKYTTVLIMICLLAVSLGGIYSFSSSVKTYVNNIVLKKDFSFSEYNILIVGSINVRFVNWSCAYKVLKENNNWLYGVGAGSAQFKMQECYKEGNQWVYKNKMNSHNQFLEETLYNGVLGLLLFLTCIFLSGFISYKKNNFLHLAFLTLFFICCLTESILGRQIGILFYSFFNSLLLFQFKNKVPVDI